MRGVVICSWTVFLCLPVCLKAEESDPPRRLMPCPATSAQDVCDWQVTARTTLFALMKIDDLVAGNRTGDGKLGAIPLKAIVLETKEYPKFVRQLLDVESYPGRQIKVVLTVPRDAQNRKTSAVVCIHGHGGTRDIVYDESTIYHGFANVLAENGYVTLSTDVGQHEVQDPNRTLMGERLWDVMRVVDLAVSRPEVAVDHIGCAGLSLGGEMAMWLGAMDTRISATVSSGFLTNIENLRHGHCMCWDFPGLQRRYDFSDIYCLVSPRPLQCQNGQKERLPGGFPVNLAERAMREIRAVYAVQDAQKDVELDVHPGGHEFDVPGAIRFLKRER